MPTEHSDAQKNIARVGWTRWARNIGLRWVCFPSLLSRTPPLMVSWQLKCKYAKQSISRPTNIKHPIRHDQIASLLGAPADPFNRQHKTQLTEMKCLVMHYVYSVQEMLKLNTAGTVDGTGSATSAKNTHLEVDANGYPKLLLSFNPRSCTKRDLEDVMRRYLAKHYSMFLYQCQISAYNHSLW